MQHQPDPKRPLSWLGATIVFASMGLVTTFYLYNVPHDYPLEHPGRLFSITLVLSTAALAFLGLGSSRWSAARRFGPVPLRTLWTVAMAAFSVVLAAGVLFILATEVPQRFTSVSVCIRHTAPVPKP